MSHIEDLSHRIAEAFNRDKIILFGFHAYGTLKRDRSDRPCSTRR